MGISKLLYGFCLGSLLVLPAWTSPIVNGSTTRLATENPTTFSITQAPPLRIPGSALAAKVNKRAAEDLPDLDFTDIALDTPGRSPILTNFLETGVLDSEWGTPICDQITKFDPTQVGNGGIFNFNVQGTHKTSLSLVHDKRYFHLYVSFSTADSFLLPKYNLKDLCKTAFHQAAQTNHELKYGFFGIQSVFSVLNNHLIRIQPSVGGEKVKRSSFGAPIGIINIQIGDQAQGVDIFKFGALP
jgi:hypothetical protein